MEERRNMHIDLYNFKLEQVSDFSRLKTHKLSKTKTGFPFLKKLGKQTPTSEVSQKRRSGKKTEQRREIESFHLPQHRSWTHHRVCLYVQGSAYSRQQMSMVTHRRMI
ncbi:hypothetical protein Dimus_033840 [Dionaea muscipula]